MSAIAIAVFVKTPGLSAIKTRLAAGAGTDTAREFYRRSLAITEAVVASAAIDLPGVRPYWAVAERDALAAPAWQSFATLWQGEGDLGERLHRVYDQLQRAHGSVLLIGADCPLLGVTHLRNARETLCASACDFVVGRAEDGGFYLFGGRTAIPEGVWRAVGYSAEDTADQLLRQLGPLGQTTEIATLPDVDTMADLVRLAARSSSSGTMLPSQVALLDWVRRLVDVDKSRKVDTLIP